MQLSLLCFPLMFLSLILERAAAAHYITKNVHTSNVHVCRRQYVLLDVVLIGSMNL